MSTDQYGFKRRNMKPHERAQFNRVIGHGGSIADANRALAEYQLANNIPLCLVPKRTAYRVRCSYKRLRFARAYEGLTRLDSGLSLTGTQESLLYLQGMARKARVESYLSESYLS